MVQYDGLTKKYILYYLLLKSLCGKTANFLRGLFKILVNKPNITSQLVQSHQCRHNVIFVYMIPNNISATCNRQFLG